MKKFYSRSKTNIAKLAASLPVTSYLMAVFFADYLETIINATNTTGK